MKPLLACDELHPAVPAAYLAGALGLVMATFHPVYVALSCALGLACSVLVRGWRATLASLAWQVPLTVFMVAVNVLVGSQGSTPAFELFGRTVMAEKLAYGACMGGVLMASIIWFSCAARVMSMDKVTALLGRFAPVTGTTVALVSRLVPLYVRRARVLDEVERANTAGAGQARGKAQAKAASAAKAAKADDAAAGADGTDAAPEELRRRGLRGIKPAVEHTSRRLSVLMGWGMEDSLETADSMLARGWGLSARRTTYRRYRFAGADAAALAVVLAVFAAALAGAINVCTPFAFYPVMGPWVPNAGWGYLAFACYLLLPILFEGGAMLLWRR